MTFQEALRFLDSFVNYEKSTSYNYKKSLKLERMRRLLEAINNPHKGIGSVQVAGTKGKGSTAVTIASILEKAGFKTGLYTSPHLSSFKERIKINGKEIPEDSIAEIVESIRPEINKLKK